MRQSSGATARVGAATPWRRAAMLTLASAVVVLGCDRKPSGAAPTPPPASAAKASAPADDPRVPCPPGTVQKRYDGGPARALSIWCVDADGQKHGPDKTWFLDGGQISEENFKHGATDGIQRKWYAEGVLESESVYRDGEPDGLSRAWHPNGRPSFALEYRNGEPVGVGRWWDENGRLVKTKRYGDGPSASKRSASPAPR